MKKPIGPDRLLVPGNFGNRELSRLTDEEEEALAEDEKKRQQAPSIDAVKNRNKPKPNLYGRYRSTMF